MARSPQVGLHQQPNTPTSTSTNNTFKAIDILPAVNGGDSYGAMHEKPHA